MKNTIHSTLDSFCLKKLHQVSIILFFGFLLFFNSSEAQVTIISDNFETGFGNWNDGGNDCDRVNNTLIGGNWNIRLRDNSGVASSMTSDLIDLTPYTQLNIRLNFYIQGYENGENFFIQYFSGGGGPNYTLATYQVGSGVNNNTNYSATIVMTVADYVFGNNARFRIRSNASDNGDQVYIDDISIIGYTPPVNDECSNAISLTSDTTCNTTTGSTLGATQSLSGCSGTADDDVWYSFVANDTEHTITVTPSSLNDVVFQVFDSSCGGSSLVCEDSTFNSSVETTTLTGLTIGNTYYIRIYSYSNNNRRRGTFSICVTEPCSVSTDPGTTDLGCPSVDAGAIGLNGGDLSLNCYDDNNVVLEAEYLEIGNTTSYSVESIPYNPPFQFNCLANPVSVNIDDRWSPVINLPFDFCFYGNTYDSCVIGSNGVISFDTSLANSYSGWFFTQNIPTNSNSDAGHYGPSIYGVHHDVDPSIGGEIGYQLITLDTGCQALVASWSDVPMYNDNSILYSGMMVFYENTNVIEVYVKEKNIDGFSSSFGGPWNDGNGIIGIQADSSTGLAAPGRNALDANWTASNEAWRFTPNGSSITELRWYENSISASNEIIDPDNDGQITVTPTSTTDYYAEVTYSLCNGTIITETDVTTVTVTGSKIWDGSEDDDWHNPDNWSPSGVPDITNCVVIPPTANDPRIYNNMDATGYNMEIQNGADLLQRPNSTLTIDDAIIVEPSATYRIRTNASVIQIDDVTTNKNVGISQIRRSVGGIGTYDYVYWSTPVSGFNVQDISPGSSNNYIFNWIPTVANGTAGNHGTWVNTTENMIAGKGYIVRGLSGTIATNQAQFEGVLNNGKISYPISRGSYTGADYAGIGNTATAQDDNWNLLGNPYPSAISLDDFVAANSAIDGTLYFWQHLTPVSTAITDPFYQDYVYNYSPNDYMSANSLGSTPSGFNGYIASGQGFFALMLDSAPTPNIVSFDNTMRGLYANDVFYRNSSTSNQQEKHRIWLDMVDQNNEAISILVGYANGASDDIDRLYDGFSLNSSATQFYSRIQDEKLSIQGLALPFEDTDTIPLGYVAPNTSSFTISINQVDGLFSDQNQDIYLEDTELNIIHNLKLNPYSFATDAGIFNDRFVLRFNNSTLGVDDEELISSLNIRKLHQAIEASSTLTNIESFELFDITGRTIHKNFKVDAQSYNYQTHNLSTGTYVVKVVLANGSSVSKKLII